MAAKMPNRALRTLILALLAGACTAAPATAAAPICHNKTQVVLASIRTQSTIEATADIIDASQTCTDGYRWTGTECVQQIVTDGHCAGGYEWLDGRCERIESAVCPAGYHMSPETGRCSLRVEFQVNCPPEHSWDGVNCVHSMPSCQAGYQLGEGGFCIKLVDGECPKGTQLEGDRCVQVKTTTFECLDDYELIGDTCRRRGEIICEADSRLVDGRCVREVSVDPEYRCPEGTRLEGRKCVSRASHCPEGYVLNGTQCVNVTIACPPNTTMDADQRCVQTVCQPIAPECQEGFRLWNGACIAVLPEKPKNCNGTHILINSTCVSECRTVRPECPNGGGHRCDVCPYDFQLIDNWCVYRRHECAVFEKCPTGFVWQNSRCELEEKKCLNGYVLQNGRCVQVEWPCPSGWRPAPNGEHECVRLNITCPLGQTLNGTVCVTVCTTFPCTPPVPQCKPGYTLHNGLCHCDSNPPPQPQPPSDCPHDRRLPNGTCSTVVVVNCTVGFHFDASIGRCVQSCPDGFEQRPDGQCYLRACAQGYWRNAIGVCVRFVCPDGFEQQPNGNCHQRPCSTGYWRNAAGVCLPIVCPSGYEYKQGACFPNQKEPQVDPQPQPPVPHPNCTTTVVPCADHHHQTQSHPNNVVHTVTIVDRPVNVVTNNENNVNVHLYENGRLVRIQRNNETLIVGNNATHTADGGVGEVEDINGEGEVVVGDDGDDGGDGGDDGDGAESKHACCVVVSPRKCEQKGDQWECTHRETQQCGWFCTSAKVYLIPRRTVYRNDVLVMRPPPNGANWWRHAGWNSGALDCSGCVGGSYACSQQCYQYESCDYRDDCHFMDQKAFCDTNPREGCAEEDGCFEY